MSLRSLATPSEVANAKAKENEEEVVETASVPKDLLKSRTWLEEFAGVGGVYSPPSFSSSSSSSSEFNIGRIYTSWGRWSKCRRTCKQVRKR